MAIHTLQFPDRTEEILSKVAHITGVYGDNWAAEVVEDALRTYWLIIQEQEGGRVIASVSPDVVKHLTQEGVSSDVGVLKTLVRQDPARDLIPA